jgi:divalent metal cation (Fe/Co/Zn/Cd) transporter
MTDLVQIACKPGATSGSSSVPQPTAAIFWLQGITLAWMTVECSLSLWAAASAKSPALLAFGSDSLVELLSATAVLLQFLPRFPLSERSAHRGAAVLLFILAGIVALTAALSFALGLHPETSVLGIATTIAALVAMPVLAWLKDREAVRIGNAALAADAVQSAACAYLAAITLTGLALNALFRTPWFDSVAALFAVPFLIKEGREAWRGNSCGCCG